MMRQGLTDQSVQFATDVSDIAAETGEIETHLHSYERWFETAAVPDAEDHVADRVGSGSGAFVIDADNDDWGTWVQILGADDTPAVAGMNYYDLHRLEISNAERDEVYFVQIAFGADGATALAANDYTEAVFKPASNQIDAGPVVVKSERQTAGTKAWARCMCPGQDTGNLSLFIGLHEYEV